MPRINKTMIVTVALSVAAVAVLSRVQQTAELVNPKPASRWSFLPWVN